MSVPTIRAKFKLDEIVTRRGNAPTYDATTGKHTGWEPRTLYDAKFLAVMGGSGDDNQKFWEATPSGRVEITTVRMMPWVDLLGHEFYFDITPATP